jgi:hypothetical protein
LIRPLPRMPRGRRRRRRGWVNRWQERRVLEPRPFVPGETDVVGAPPRLGLPLPCSPYARWATRSGRPPACAWARRGVRSLRTRPLHLALFGLLATSQLRHEPLHGAPHLGDLGERIAQRFLCLAACVWLNQQLGRPSRSLVAYVAGFRGINHLALMRRSAPTKRATGSCARLGR